MMKALSFLLVLLVTGVSCHSTTGNLNTEGMQDILSLVRKNDVPGVKLALERGAAINTVDESKRSLLLIATNNRHTEMAELLVKYGADVNQQADNLDSPFLYAGASGQTELVRLFLSHGARFDVFNRYYGTALIPACERGHVETVRLLVETTGYPIDHVNRLGWTALMEAIVLGDGSESYQEIVRLLKTAGADLNIPDHDGVTPLQHARSRGFNAIVDILKP